jgi:hypothetical protein
VGIPPSDTTRDADMDAEMHLLMAVLKPIRVGSGGCWPKIMLGTVLWLSSTLAA